MTLKTALVVQSSSSRNRIESSPFLQAQGHAVFLVGKLTFLLINFSWYVAYVVLFLNSG